MTPITEIAKPMPAECTNMLTNPARMMPNTAMMPKEPQLVNMFLNSAGVGFAISTIGVIAFTALTAYDTQKIKEMYSESWGAESNGKLALMGALNLYLDFINLFLMLLRLMGNRR